MDTFDLYAWIKKENNNLDFDKYNKIKTQIYQILFRIKNYLCIHIKNQINAGADVVQIFDSWAGLIPRKKLKIFVIFQIKK